MIISDNSKIDKILKKVCRCDNPDCNLPFLAGKKRPTDFCSDECKQRALRAYRMEEALVGNL